MFILASIVVFTSNVLGSFQDPFEFDGDYGPEINPTREKVFDLVLPEEGRRVSFEELIPPDLLDSIEDSELVAFLKEHSEEDAMAYLRGGPKKLLRLDKILRDKASSKGEILKLSILSSAYPLDGDTPTMLKENLMYQLFEQGHSDELKSVDVPSAYQLFHTPKGQVAFYWLYQSLNLHLVSQESEMIEEINRVKSIFLKTMGDANKRAETFKKQLAQAQAEVLFTQESDQSVVSALCEDDLFLLHQGQNMNDGTFVFLKSGVWNENVEVIPLEVYQGYQHGKVNLLLATSKKTNQKFLLASCHGNSTDPADGRLQVQLIMQRYHELLRQHPHLQLLIGIDANTKSEEDVRAFYDHLDRLGLEATNVGPTTVKKRMVTVQRGKAGRLAIDQEDFLITLKPESGGEYSLSNPTVGFKKGKRDVNRPLPNLDNLSDHYPVGATLVRRAK